MRTREDRALIRERTEPMSLVAIARRSTTPLFGVVAACAVAGCSAGIGPSDFDGRAAAEAAETACAPTGRAPTFALSGFAEDGSRSILVSVSPEGAPFAAFVQFRHGGDAPVTGGQLVPAPGGAYAAQAPDLRAGTTYRVSLQGMQGTNLAPECQKSFAVDLGTLTAH